MRSLPDFLVGIRRAYTGDGSKSLVMLAEIGHGAALQAQVSEDQSLQSGLRADARTAGDEVTVAKDALRKLNATP